MRISVEDSKDPSSILLAFQIALSTVVTAESVKKILTEQNEAHLSQQVFWKGDKPAFGCVTMQRNESRDEITVVVTVSRNRKSSDLAPLPAGFIEGAFVQFKNEKFQFLYDKTNKEFRATLTRPSRQFHRNPKVSILTSE